eukprot:2115776-Pleurochrysis_carterae.AAC.1
MSWVKRALEVDSTNADAWCALGSLRYARREWPAADACFKRVLSRCEPRDACKRDAYALLSLGNISVELAVEAQRKAADSKDGLDAKHANAKHANTDAGAAVSPYSGLLKDCIAKLDKATELYRAVLSHEPNNAYAANGLGIVCVLKGRLAEGRDIFSVVKEAAPECETVHLNLAQVHARAKETTIAVNLYHKAQRRRGGEAAATAAALEARALLEGGHCAEARRALSKALHMRPSDTVGWYNMGVLLHKGARPRHSSGVGGAGTVACASEGGASSAAVASARSVEEVELAQAHVSLALRLRHMLERSGDGDGDGEGGDAEGREDGEGGGGSGGRGGGGGGGGLIRLSAARVSSLMSKCVNLQAELEGEHERAVAHREAVAEQ